MWQKFKNFYHLLKAFAANVYFGFPASKITVIGITGTDGKTTTTNLVYHILKTAGKSASMVSTVGANIHGKSLPLGFHVTNPASWQLQKFLSDAAKSSAKQNYLVLEVTSHGIDQNRIWGIPFAIAGLTNITHEHLDYHKTYDNYMKTKCKFLNNAKIAIVNKDDISYGLLSEHCKKSFISYSLKQKADIMQKDFTYIRELLGEYNRYNALLAIAVCSQLGLNRDEIKKGIQTFKFPKGRTEVVYKNDFTIMVDFAHTPNAFEQLLSTIRPKVEGKIIHVFGSAGERDHTKRPEMGKIAGKYDDIIILTSEDPRSESVAEINKAISSNLKNNKNIIEIPDRQEAINKAISLAKKGDFVLLTGKAHETSMNYGSGEKPWSEYEAIENALDTLGLV